MALGDHPDNSSASLSVMLQQRLQWVVGRFPYAECRVLLVGSHSEDLDLIPDLAGYWATLAGYCSWGTKVHRWSDEKVIAVDDWCQLAFLDRFPIYAELFHNLDADTFPYLSGRIAAYDGLLNDLRALMVAIRTERAL